MAAWKVTHLNFLDACEKASQGLGIAEYHKLKMAQAALLDAGILPKHPHRETLGALVRAASDAMQAFIDKKPGGPLGEALRLAWRTHLKAVANSGRSDGPSVFEGRGRGTRGRRIADEPPGRVFAQAQDWRDGKPNCGRD